MSNTNDDKVLIIAPVRFNIDINFTSGIPTGVGSVDIETQNIYSSIDFVPATSGIEVKSWRLSWFDKIRNTNRIRLGLRVWTSFNYEVDIIRSKNPISSVFKYVNNSMDGSLLINYSKEPVIKSSTHNCPNAYIFKNNEHFNYLVRYGFSAMPTLDIWHFKRNLKRSKEIKDPFVDIPSEPLFKISPPIDWTKWTKLQIKGLLGPDSSDVEQPLDSN